MVFEERAEREDKIVGDGGGGKLLEVGVDVEGVGTKPSRLFSLEWILET